MYLTPKMNHNNSLLITPDTPLILSDRTRAYLENSKALNTKKAYENAWKDFCGYCFHTARVEPLPCSAQTVLDYVTKLADVGAKVATIDQRVAAIAFMHKVARFEDPTAHSVVREVLKGIRRTRARDGEKQTQAAPITRDDLFLIVAALPDDLRGKRDKALLLLTFACARRESEIVALDVADVQFTPKEMIVTIARSKTDQEGAGVKKRVSRLSDESEMICPVRAVRAWLDAAEITGGPLFRKVDYRNKVWDRRSNPRMVEQIVKRTMRQLGRDPALYSGHSLRAGFVTQAGEDGSALHEIMDVTDHKSMDMVRRYMRHQGLSAQRTIKRTLGE